MTFFELLNRDGASVTEEKTIIAYKADGNGVKTVKKPIVNLEKLYGNESIRGMYADFSDGTSAAIYKDFEPCWKVQDMYRDIEADKMESALTRYNSSMWTYTDFCRMIEDSIADGYYIKNDALMLLRLHGSMDLLQRVTEEKQSKIEASERAEAEEARKRAEEERRQAEAEKAEKERRKAEKADFLCGFADEKTAIQTERLYDILSKKHYYEIDGKSVYLSRKDFIIEVLNHGGRSEKKDGVVSYYGSKWNPKKSKPKTEYRLYTDKNSFYVINKTEYDFAVYMTGKIKKNDFSDGNFIDDAEKMRDFEKLTKEEFLQSYSYLTEAEYDNTKRLLQSKKKALTEC